MKLLKDLPIKSIKGKKIVLRVDFNVPLNQNGEVVDDTRIRAGLKTIKYLIQAKAKKIYLISHLGRPIVRPKETIENIVLGNENLTLQHVSEKLAEWLKSKRSINKIFLDEVNFPAYEILGNLVMLENIRFDSGEEKNDAALSKKLASLSKENEEKGIYVNDAFSVSHRAHASVEGITKYLPSYAGFLVEKEIENLNKLAIDPEKPFIIILGGAKVFDKMMVIKNLLRKADYFLLGGVMANTFMSVRGIDVKKSLIERDRLELADELFKKAPKKFIFPVSLVWDKGKIVDVDPKGISLWKRYFEKANTIFWNGTMGLTSLGNYKFAQGTKELANLIVASKAKKIVAGGDTIAEVAKLKLEDKFDFVSTGGGATLEYLAGNKLPGLEALK